MADGASDDGTSSSHATGESSESTIEINIKTLDSKIYTFRVNKDMPVSMLKEKIVNVTGVPVEQQRLIFRGKVLKDDHLLSAYHLENEHTLHLVARQPVEAQATTGTSSEDAARNNANQGDGSTGAPRTRTGQVSHSVVLGTVNIADQGEGMAADISRLVGAVLNSFGVGNMAPNGGASNTSSVTPNQASPSAETEGTQNASSGTQPSNPVPGFTILNHPFQSLQIPQIPRLTAIPDSLATLSEFISRMELALHHGGSQASPPTNVQDPPRSEVPSSNSRGLPTPEALGALMERVQQLLTGNAAAAVSHIAARLGREGASSDPVVRGQVQSEAMHVGVAMQHLGAMFLELGRTIMTLRMGQSPTEAVVNAGPAVYISPTGPNPIMVQPFPLQSTSLFGVPPPSLFSGAPGPFGAGNPSRNVNIHIHAGPSVTPGVSSVGTRANLGEAIRGERPNVEQASINGNGSGDAVPMRGVPSRTVASAIPARSAAESSSHVLSVIYPVHVRSQQSVSVHSASAQASRPTASSGTQPNTLIPVPQPSSESVSTSTLADHLNAHIASVLAAQPSSDSVSTSTLVDHLNAHMASVLAAQPSSGSVSTPTPVDHLNAHIASVLGGNTQGQSLSNPSMPSTDTRGSHPSMRNGAQINIPSSASMETPLGSDSNATQINAQLPETLSYISQGQSSSPSDEYTDTSRPREGPQPLPPGSTPSGLGADDVNCLADRMAETETNDRSGSDRSHVHDTGMLGSDGQQLIPGGLHFSNSANNQENSVMDESSTTKSMDGPAISQASDTFSSNPVMEKKLDSIATEHTSRSSQGSGIDSPGPLGLGLGGLQPKRRGKPSKPKAVPHGTPSTNQNQQSIARGQQVLHSLVSQSSDMNRVDANGSSIPLPSVISQIMDGMPLGVQGASGQVDSANMISHALQSPALNSLLTGVAEQAGLGSPATLRNMLEQCTRNPGVMNTMNEIVQQVGQNEDIGGMLSGLGTGNGGMDFSRMIQQMMPVVSQALGRGSTRLTPVPGMQSEPPPQCHDANTGENDMLDDRNSQIDVQQAVERIEQHDSPGNVFRAVLESAARSLGEGNSFGDLVEELGDNMELTSEFTEMLQRRIRQRLQGESTAKDKS